MPPRKPQPEFRPTLHVQCTHCGKWWPSSWVKRFEWKRWECLDCEKWNDWETSNSETGTIDK